MITLQSIHLQNFLSHLDTTLELKDSQRLLIDGKSGDGKSSIVEGLTWCLYNVGRADNRSLIKRGEKSMKVTVHLKDGEKFYAVERGVTSSGKHSIAVSESTDGNEYVPIKVSGTREIQSYLEKEILRSSYILFVNSISYPQDNIESFVRQTSTKRKEILMEMIRASDFDAFYEKAKDELSTAQSQETVINTTISTIEEGTRLDRISVSDETTLKQKFDEVSSSLSQLNQEREKNEVALLDIRVACAQVKDKRYQLQTLSRNVEDYKKIIEEFKKNDGTEDSLLLENKKLAFGLLQTQERASREWNEKMMSLLREKPVEKDYPQLIMDCTMQITHLEQSIATACPVQHDHCPVLISERQNRLQSLKETLQSLQEKKNEYDIQQGQFYAKQKELEATRVIFDDKMYYTLSREIAPLEERVQKRNAMKAKVEMYQKTVDESTVAMEKALDEIKKLEFQTSALDSFERVQQELKMKIVQLTAEYNVTMQKLAVVKEAQERLQKNEERLTVLRKELVQVMEKIEGLTLLKDAFGNKGLVSIIVDQLLPQLEDKINAVLGKLSDFRIVLSTQRKGAGDDVILEGLFIDIIAPTGETMDFSLLSGGEKVKVSAAISAGLASIQRFDFRIFDETVQALDAETVEAFVEVLLQLQDEVKQTIMISHIQNIKDLFEEKVTIQKLNGISKIIN